MAKGSLPTVDLVQLRQTLVSRLEELGHRVQEFEVDLREPLDADFAEQATQMEGDEVISELEHSAIKEARQIKAAVLRIDDGKYGECVGCGAEIDPRRLQALPFAVECIQCAANSS